MPLVETICPLINILNICNEFNYPLTPSSSLGHPSPLGEGQG
jgi:hypothetical protein